MHRYRVGILGAGVAGTSLSLELATKGISCAVVDENPIGGYSSTKNQGWIHGGALYVAYRQFDVALDCKAGYANIKKFIGNYVPQALPPHSTKSIYMANDENELERIKSQCRARGIRCDDLDSESISELRRHPRGEGFDFAANVDDLPINTTMYLSELSQQACRSGACFLPIEGKMKSVRVDGSPGNWEIETAKGKIQTDVLVLSCGVLIPDVLTKLGVSQAVDWFDRERILVSVLLKSMFNSLFVFVPQRHEGAPNISPFFNEKQVQMGSTVCLLRGEAAISKSDDFSTPTYDIDQVSHNLEKYYPDLSSQMKGKSVPMHFYACQKIGLGEKAPQYNGSQSERKHIILNHGDSKLGKKNGVYSFYPGKFTAAPHVASEFANRLIDEQESLKSPETLMPFNDPPAVANRQCTLGATHKLCEVSGHLRIEPLT